MKNRAAGGPMYVLGLFLLTFLVQTAYLYGMLSLLQYLDLITLK